MLPNDMLNSAAAAAAGRSLHLAEVANDLAHAVHNRQHADLRTLHDASQAGKPAATLPSHYASEHMPMAQNATK
jgi:hypothetical protein